MKAWAGAIDRDRKRRENALAVLFRAAQHYEPKDFDKFLNPPKE